MPVEQYSTEFQKLSRYAPYLIPDEETKVKRFCDGLVLRILEMIIFVKVTDYTKMVHIATMADEGIKTAVANYINRKWSMYAGAFPPPPSKRHATGSSTGSYGRKNNSPSLGSGSPQRCSKCGKPHLGECRLGFSACFKCGKVGHFTRECSQANANRGQGSQVSINQPRPAAPVRV
jgi:hypothetical protein